MAKDEPRTFPVDDHIPFDGRRMSKAYLSNGTPMKLFFNSGASRSYSSKRFYDSNPVLHDMPKFVTTCTGIRIGNGIHCSSLICDSNPLYDMWTHF